MEVCCGWIKPLCAQLFRGDCWCWRDSRRRSATFCRVSTTCWRTERCHWVRTSEGCRQLAVFTLTESSDDGRFLINPERYDALLGEMSANRLSERQLVRVHPDFVVIALGLPVPRFQGYPLDPVRHRLSSLFPLSSRTAVEVAFPSKKHCRVKHALATRGAVNALLKCPNAITQSSGMTIVMQACSCTQRCVMTGQPPRNVGYC